MLTFCVSIIFSEEERKDISSQLSLEFAFTHRNANTFSNNLQTTFQMVT